MTDLPQRTSTDYDSASRMAKFRVRITKAARKDDQLTDLEMITVLMDTAQIMGHRMIRGERKEADQ